MRHRSKVGIEMQNVSKAAGRLYRGILNREREIGVPVGRTRTGPAVAASDTVTLPGGVVVNRVRYDGFHNAFVEFEKRVIADPKALRPGIGELSARLLTLHRQDLEATRKALHAEYRRPIESQWQSVRAAWRQAFADDPEIGKNRRDTTVKQARALMQAYGKALGADRLTALREVFSDLGDHPELIRFMNWAAAKIIKTAK
jgi:hypothetical protein